MNLILATTVAVLILALKLYLKYTVRYCTSVRRLHGQVALVTGATSGIGLETAKGLAKRGAKVIFGARNVKTAEAIAEQIRTETGNKNVVVRHLDLSLLSSVRRFCAEMYKEETRLDILVNNAAVMLMERKITAEGFEVHYVTNYLGPFLLTNLLLGLMSASGSPSRIIVVSSVAHQWLRSLDLHNRNCARYFNLATIYPTTKLYTTLLTVHLHQLISKSDLKIIVNAVNPGAVDTELLRHVRRKFLLFNLMIQIGRLFFRTPWEGAQCTVHVAVADEVDGVSGKYFDNCHITGMNRLVTKENAEQLWRMSKEDAGLQKDEDWLEKYLSNANFKNGVH